MSMSEHMCLIPAKAQSTRLPGKNLLPLQGRELLAYPILAAREAELFGNNIFVSTESPEIEAVALAFGARVPFLRPEHLAHDPYGVADVALNFLQQAPELQRFTSMTILLPTAPLTSADDIRAAHEVFNDSDLKYLMSVCETEHNAQRAVFVRESEVQPLMKDAMLKKSQELEATYRVNGAIVIVDIQDFLQTGSYFNYPLGAYCMPPERSVDIDTAWDYRLAQFLMADRTEDQEP